MEAKLKTKYYIDKIKWIFLLEDDFQKIKGLLQK